MSHPRFTHIARIYGFKCYFNEYTGEIRGINWFSRYLIEQFLALDRVDNAEVNVKLIKEL